MLLVVGVNVGADDPPRVVDSEWECWKRAGGLNVGTPRIRHFDETRFDLRVIDFIEFDVLGKPPISRTERRRPTIEANHVNSGVYARSCSIAALVDCGVGKEILVFSSKPAKSQTERASQPRHPC